MDQKLIKGEHALELTFKMNEWLQFNAEIVIKVIVFNADNTEAIVFFEEKEKK